MRILLTAFALLAMSFHSAAQKKAVRTSGDVLAVAIPAAALAISWGKEDRTGIKQLVFSGATAMGSTYILKYSVQKKRPDGSNNLSFPSAHSAATFAGSTYLARRYGWKLGVPAYVLSSYVAWSRTYGRKHDWWDVSAGAALGIASSLIYTRPFARKTNLTIAPATLYDRPAVYVSYVF